MNNQDRPLTRKMNQRVFILIFLFLPSIQQEGFCQNPDINLLKEINLDRHTSWDNEVKGLTNSIWIVSPLSSLSITAAGLIKKDSALLFKGLEIGAAQGITSIVTLVMKQSIHRTRPYEKYDQLENLSDPFGSSFPSAHTSSAFALATSLTINFKKWYVIVPSYLYAAGIGYTRLHEGVHYPTDVLAGAALGSVSSIATHKLNKWVNKTGRIRYPGRRRH
jgi:membrane-associated phospholipid phosphatase